VAGGVVRAGVSALSLSAGAVALATGAAVFALAVEPLCFDVRKVSETSTTVTLGWDRQAGDGYRFYVNELPVSRTFDPSRVSVRFGKAAAYRVEVLHVSAGISGDYPPK
jgi:hypothetical protein